MKILHCADLHLDSKMEARLSPVQAKERKRELIHAYNQTVDFAAQNGISAVIIAGDLFDSKTATRKTVNAVADKIKSYPEIDFFYVAGNHDAGKFAFNDYDLPNLYVFGENFSKKTYSLSSGKQVTIGGNEITDANYKSFYGTVDFSPNDINILVLHGQESSIAGEDNVCLPSLKNIGIDYLALGHIHSFKKEKLDQRGIYSYSGCLAGRGFDECGQKGFAVIEIKEENNTLSSEFIPLKSRGIAEVECDITDKITFSDISTATKFALNNISNEQIVRLRLIGEYTADTEKDIPALLEMFQNKFYYFEIKDRSILKIDPSQYENDISLRGEFIRTVLSSRLTNEDKDSVIYCGLKALSGEEIEI